MAERGLDVKVVVIGSQGVGKTSLVIRYDKGTFTASTSSTIGAAFFTHKLSVDNVRASLQIWDTAGQERFKSMAPMYYRGAHAALIVYDVTNKETFDAVPEWLKDLRKICDKDVVICIIGNKVDLRASLAGSISTAQGAQLAQSAGAFFYETSAKDNIGIAEAFLRLTQELIRTKGTSLIAAPAPAPGPGPQQSKCCE